MRISDWSSDVCSSDLPDGTQFSIFHAGEQYNREYLTEEIQVLGKFEGFDFIVGGFLSHDRSAGAMGSTFRAFAVGDVPGVPVTAHVENKNYAIYRSEEHTSELQSLMRISYAVFCLKKKNKQTDT